MTIISFLCFTLGFTGILQVKITIDDNQIIQTFGWHPFFKPRILKWEEVDNVIKDGYLGLKVYRLLSKSAIKTKYINISMVTDMNLLIKEIVKRAKNAEIDSSIQF